MSRSPFGKRFLARVVVALAATLAFVDPATVGAQSPSAADTDTPAPAAAVSVAAARANELIVANEYDEARSTLAHADANDPAVILTKARLALYEEDCDLAVALLGRAEATAIDDGRIVLDVARGCARVIAATVVDVDEKSGIAIRYHDEADRVLTPILLDTVARAKVSLGRDLGVEWKGVTKITVVRDLLSLSAMTGLPYKAAQTTGTVAVAKWGRVTILSPRASTHGYPFRDTLTHELTHLAIAKQSRERAPLWLHEGVARREETRWREPGPFDDRPSPESLVLRGMELKLDLPLDKLGPSIAMLPSADAAMVAFAEVTSFVKFFVESSSPDDPGKSPTGGALAKLLVRLRSARSVDDALRDVSGATLSEWDTRWRAHLAKRPKESVSSLFGLGGTPPGFAESRERTRLAELLLGRNHPAPALLELENVPQEMFTDPSLRYRRARALEAIDDLKQAESLVQDPKQWVASFGPCWALRGRLARAAGNEDVALGSFDEAVSHDPFGVEAACEAAPSVSAPVTGPRAALCEAARRRGEPDVGQD